LDQESALKALVELGLSPIDAKVYLLLTKRGPKKGKELLEVLKINRQQLYRSLKSLQSKGIVSSTLERPARFSSIPTKQVLDMIIRNKIDEASKLRQQRREILSVLQSAEIGEYSDASARFTVVEDEKFIFAKIRQMVEDAKNEILVSASGLSIIQAKRADMLKTLTRLDIPFKILTNVSSTNLSTIEEVVKKIGYSEKYQGRHIDLEENLFPKFVICDEDEMIFLITKEEMPSSHKNDTGLWTNSKPLINAFKTFFDGLWREALDMGRRINELNTGETPPETILIRDASKAYQKYLTLINSAQKEVILMATAKDLARLLRLKEILDGWLKRRVLVRVMAPITKENEEIARKLSKYCEVRHVQLNYQRAVIVDGKHLLHIKAPPPGKDALAPSMYFENSFYTNDPEYVQGRRELIEDIWNNSPLAIEQLKRSEARFRSLYENSFDAILLGSPDYSISSANPAAQQMFSMSEDEIKRVGRVGVLVMDEKAKAAISTGERTGKARAELTYRRKDGSIFQGETTSGYFTDSDGTTKISVVIRDTTERKKAEKALGESERLYRALFDNTEDAFQLVEPIYDEKKGVCDFRFLKINGRFEDQIGLKACEVEGKGVEGLLHEIGSYWIETYGKVLKSGKPLHCESYDKRTDRWFDMFCFPYANNQVGVLFRDITDRKKAEKDVFEKQQELNLIFDSSPTIIFHKDREGKFIQANRAFAQALRVPKEKLLGKTVFEIYSAEIAEGMTNDDAEVFESKLPKLGIIEPYESPTGSRWIRTDKIPTVDEKGVVNGLIGFSEEITEQKEAELELKRRYNLLESISESIGAGLAIIDQNYRIVWTTRRLETLAHKLANYATKA